MGTMNLSSHFPKDVYSMISSSSFGRKLANNTKPFKFAITKRKFYQNSIIEKCTNVEFCQKSESAL